MQGHTGAYRHHNNIMHHVLIRFSTVQLQGSIGIETGLQVPANPYLKTHETLNCAQRVLLASRRGQFQILTNSYCLAQFKILDFMERASGLHQFPWGLAHFYLLLKGLGHGIFKVKFEPVQVKLWDLTGKASGLHQFPWGLAHFYLFLKGLGHGIFKD